MRATPLVSCLLVAGLGCSDNEAASASTEGGVQKATVLIEDAKYNPATIRVKRGQPVELTFTGGKELGCGGTVVFKSLNQTKKVETGKSVTFAFTPDKAGDIRFTCDMDMFDGKVVVE